MERFVLLRHTLPEDSARADHWDLMLETGGILRTWELLTVPAAWQAALDIAAADKESDEVLARALAGHRLAYLDYEGTVSGGRGEVRREAGGGLRWIECSETSAVAELLGDQLHCTVRLVLQRDADWVLSAE